MSPSGRVTTPCGRKREELGALHEQEREGHSTPKEQRRAEQLERRLGVDEHGADVRERLDPDHDNPAEKPGTAGSAVPAAGTASPVARTL